MWKPWRTAIARKDLPSPTKYLLKNELQDYNGRILDYGCGKCHDINIKYFPDIEGFDPHYKPEKPVGTFGVVLCHYVLNVLDKEQRLEVLRDIARLVDDRAFITVRRDINQDYTTGCTRQFVVVLPLRTHHKTKDYEMYVATREEILHCVENA